MGRAAHRKVSERFRRESECYKGGNPRDALNGSRLDGIEHMEYRVKVTTRAKSDSVVPLLDGRLSVAVTADRKGGRANEHLRELLAGHFAVPLSAVTIRRGHTSSTKSVFVKKYQKERE